MANSKQHDKDFANTILENAGALIVVLDHEGHIVLFNHACEKLSGCTFAEMKGKFLWETLLPSEDAETICKSTFETLANNPQAGPIKNTHYWVAKNNKRYLLDWSNSLLLDASGNMEYMISIGTDVTESHHVEDVLRQSEAQSRNIIDASPVPFALNDEQQNITYLNPAFVKTFGYDQNDIPTLADWWPKAYPDADYRHWVATTWQDNLDKAKREGTLFEPLELNIQCKDGTQRTALVGAASLTESFKDVHLVTFYDITERKRVEENLRETHEKLKTSIDNMPNAYILVDTETRVLEWNKAAEKIFGYSKEEMLGKNVIDFIVPEKVRHLVGKAVKKLKTGEVADYSEKDNNIRKDGKLISCHWYNTPLADLNGNVFGILLMAQDVTERKQTEENLRDASLLNTRIIEESPIGLAIYDHTGQCLEANESVAQMIGATREQMLKQNYNDILSWKECGLYTEAQMAIEDNVTRRFDALIDTTFEKHIYLDFQIVPFSARDQKHLLLMATDITERKHFEETNKKLAERLELATGAARIGIWDWNIEKDELLWDDRMFELYGVKKGEFNGAYEAWVAGLHPDDREHAEQSINQALQKEKPYDIEFRVCWPDGTIRNLKASGQVVWDEQGNALRMLGINYDISAQHQAREALLEGDKHFRALFDQSSFGVAKIDSQTGRFIKINARYCDLVGYTIDEMLAMDFQTITFPEDLQADLDNMERLRDGEISMFQMEKRYHCKNSSVVWVNLSVMPLWSQGKTPDFHLAIVEDITERKHIEAELEHHHTHLEELVKTRTVELEQKILDQARAEEALQQATLHAEKANMAKSEFLASMSHELRTPMNSILGFGQLLTLDPEMPLTDRQQDYVDQILDGGQHLLELINGILDLAKIEAGKVNLAIEGLQVEPLLDKCLKLVRTLAQERKIQLIRKYVDNKYIISADFTRTQQVLLNLLSNAIKYNRTGGTVTIDCQEISAGMLNINITDTGHGIPVNKQDELFQPFNRLDIETTNIEGTGIGLTVSKSLVELMGGNIGFNSVPEKGSTFWFELPLLDNQALKNMPTTDSLVKSNKFNFPIIPGTLLYVEDNPSNLKLMEAIALNIGGLKMVSTNTAEDGIEIARTQQPDIIILDINLPGMNGIEALGILKQLEETAHIPVLALSASASQRDIDKGLEAGFLHYLTKPLQIKEVIKILKRILAARNDDH